MHRMFEYPIHNMNKKLCTFLQNGRPLTSRQAKTLEADKRVASYFTEASDEGSRLISISLTNEYNYEQRTKFIAWDWQEVTEMLSNVEEGEPDPRNG